MVLTGSLSWDLESPCLLDHFEAWGGGVPRRTSSILSNFRTVGPRLGTLTAAPTPTPEHRTPSSFRSRNDESEMCACTQRVYCQG